MAATTYGVAYVFGVTATSPTASQIISHSLGKSDANVNEVGDGSGAKVTERTDDQRDDLELELKFTASFTEPEIGSVLVVVDAGTPSIAGEYMVKTTNLSASNKDFKTYKVTAQKSEYLNLTP